MSILQVVARWVKTRFPENKAQVPVLLGCCKRGGAPGFRPRQGLIALSIVWGGRGATRAAIFAGVTPGAKPPAGLRGFPPSGHGQVPAWLSLSSRLLAVRESPRAPHARRRFGLTRSPGAVSAGVGCRLAVALRCIFLITDEIK